MKTAIVFLAVVCSQAAWGKSFCETRSLDGTYAFLANGSLLVPGTPITGPFMRIGYFVADGKGSIVFTTLAIYNGINFGAEHFGGTYSVTSDCALDMHVAVPAPAFANVEFKGQLAASGNDAAFMLFNTDNPQAPPITTVVGFGKQREVSRCSTDDLNGNWRIEINGFRNLAPGSTGTAYRQVGQIDADGKGGLLASFVTSNNGAISQDTAAGKYTVSSDCTFDLNYTIAGAPYSVRGSFIDEDTAFASLNLTGPALPTGGILAGAVATGTMVKQTSGRSRHE